jgi:hypothetical protein
VEQGIGATQNAHPDPRRVSADVRAEPIDATDATAILNAVCTRLRSARRSQGTDLAYAARRMGVSPSVLSRLERAERDSCLRRLVLASGMLGLRLSDVLRLAEDDAFPLGRAPWAASPTTASHGVPRADQSCQSPAGSD